VHRELVVRSGPLTNKQVKTKQKPIAPGTPGALKISNLLKCAITELIMGLTEKFGTEYIAALDSALANAPTLTPTQSGNSASESIESAKADLSKVSHLADSGIVFSGFHGRPPNNEVHVKDRESYTRLLGQACVVAGADRDDGNYGVIDNYVQRIVDHENQHWIAARQVMPRPSLRYCLGFVRLDRSNDEPRIALAPSIQVAGFARKIDLAYIMAAPSQLSEQDIASINFLGYDSTEEVMFRRTLVSGGAQRIARMLRLAKA
jgi:hypothetical protein